MNEGCYIKLYFKYSCRVEEHSIQTNLFSIQLLALTPSHGSLNCETFFLHFFPVYHCGSEEGWSDVFFFTALNDSTTSSPRFAFYGDLGNENPQSLARLQKETQLGTYDVILHIGNFYPSRYFIIHLCKRGIKLYKPQLKALVIHSLY